MHRDQKSWRLAGAVLVGVLMTVGAAGVVSAKGVRQTVQQARPVDPITGTVEPDANDPEHAKLRDQQVQAATDARRKRLVADADRLLVLATHLKEEVDKSTKDEMSVPAIKDATEMEKLAREVKEKLKGN